MLRINTINAILNYFGEGKAGFGAGNPTTGTKATYLSAEWCNAIQEEIANVIEAAEIELNAENHTQLLEAITAIVASGIGAGVLRRATNTPDLAAGFYITPLALAIDAGVATPVFLDRNLRTIAVDQSFTLANPATIPAGGGARIIATQDGTGGWALTLGSAYRIIGGEWSADPDAVNILEFVFGGPGGLIDVDITQRGAA